MLVADSGHHTKPTSYQPIEIKAKKCSSSNIRSISPSSSQTQTTLLATAARKTATFSLNNSLNKLPPISSFFNKNILEKEALLSNNNSQSTTTSTKPLLSSKTTSANTASTLSPSFKSSSKPAEYDNAITPLNKVTSNKATTLIIPTFRSQQQQQPHQHHQIGSTSSICKQSSSNELLRRLAQPNTIPPTTSHRIPNSDSTSNDSLNLEMCYFKPIKPVPITPPKKGSIVIKRPLPKRIKSKRRKCDVFIGPKKGQMPILFSTVTPFKRCSAFYSNNETTALKSPCEIPDLNLSCPFPENIETNKNLIKGKQIVNNLSREVNDKSKSKFYLRKCYVILERSNLEISFKAKTKGKTKKNQQKKDPVRITKTKNNLRNVKLKSNQIKKNILSITTQLQPDKKRNLNLRSNNSTVEIPKLIEETDNDESDVNISNENLNQSVNRKRYRNASIIENLEEPNIEKNVVQSRLRKLSSINVSSNEVKNVRQTISKQMDSSSNEEVNDSKEQKISSKNNTKTSNNKLPNPKIQENNRITRRNSRKSLSVQNNEFSYAETLTSPPRVKTKAAVKQIVTESNLNESIYQFQATTNQRITRKRSQLITIDEINNKKLKIDKTNDKINNDLINYTNDNVIVDKTTDQEQQQEQRITRKQKQLLKEKTDLLKSDYEFALKLQMQLELEVFPIEPVANRTRNTRSRMNISCDDISEHSSSVGLLNQNNYRYNNSNNNNDDDSDDYDNNDDNDNNEDNLYKTPSSYLKSKINCNKKIEGQSGKSSKTVKKTIFKKDGTSKSFKSSFAPLKG